MLESELVALIRNIQSVKSESNKTEVKAAAKGCPKVRDTLSSFSNQSGGGVIIFGIDENENYNVCGVYDADKAYKQELDRKRQGIRFQKPHSARLRRVSPERAVKRNAYEMV